MRGIAISGERVARIASHIPSAALAAIPSSGTLGPTTLWTQPPAGCVRASPHHREVAACFPIK
ncbi:MAG: hypothetical protein ACPIOQ_63415, partial [Promethearchaeia archaeon]